MSIYFEQYHASSSFNTSDSWIILSEIEQRIKTKIEAIGTPLKEWNININYGIKTGFNEAFIITGEKRKELIKQDPKSAEIIRPILRGRDIKRYSYDYADLWLINTHNGIKEKNIKRIDIEDYPAVKKYLDQYYAQLEKRSDKGDMPYNLRNCAYIEDFSKQKMVWKRVGSILRFSYVETDILTLDSTCFATGKYIKYLVAILNSKFGEYIMKDAPKTGTGDLLISVQAIKPLSIPLPNNQILLEIEKYIDEILLLINKQKSFKKYENDIDLIIYKMLGFSNEEIEFIEFQ